ncbi:4'-phosphopantetheinyl transferase [Rhizocola hellebori]|uniref:4'-phosphopantetheinyl transferase n=1 Tax=Rhizocola hellebori TaxID=1392758 RepID=A0A8J3VHQ7_9ACTN|nr:4'-phosphopantetheinyl transferase superfamily protein [Rhizocola hellebori]GIH06178.1 4'-phosphopantetheinyl transferase [Rhizocola hellebori]
MEKSTCQVWWAAPGLARSWHEDLLTPPERERMVRLRRHEDKQRLMIGNALLRLTIAQAAGCPVGEVVIDRSCPDCEKPHGKPTVVGHDLHVSVSHSGNRVAVALTRVAQVGIDVEQVDPRVHVNELLANILSPDEIATDMDFFTRWARKEAVLKATGLGLRMPMSKLTLGPQGLIGFDRPCVLRDLQPGPGYCAAVAVLTDAPIEIDERDGSWLLDRGDDA